MADDGDPVRSWTVADHESTRFEDDHIDPDVHLRRMRRPSGSPGDVPGQRRAGRPLAPVRHALRHRVRGAHRGRGGLRQAGRPLTAWCRERLAGYKCPRSVDVVETIGRTPMGKVNKRELRRPYWGASTMEPSA